MFDLSKRKLNTIIGCTPRTVGPSTYDYDQVPDRRQWSKAFLVGDKLTSEKKINIWTEQIYNARIPQKIKGGSTVSDHAPRFKYSRDEVLGPCAYEPPVGGDDDKDNVPYVDEEDEEINSKRSICAPRRYRLYLCHMPLSHGPTTPSIPSKDNKYGYTLINGMLQRNIVDNAQLLKDNEIPQMLRACNHYKGTSWAKSRSQRGEKQKDNLPGPGHYSPKHLSDLCRRSIDDYLMTQNKTRCTPMRRFTDEIFLKAKKNKSPAPCEYSRLSYLRKHQVLVPFGSTGGRPKPSTNDNPAPGAYEVKNEICRTRYKSTGTVAFGHSLTPPPEPIRTDLSPLSYYPKITIKDEMNRNYEKSKLIRAPFQRSSARVPCNREIFKIPGPNWYCVGESYQCEYKKKEPSSNFASKKERGARLHEEDRPEPASYSINHSFRYLTDQLSHKKIGQPKCEGFLCGTPNRFQRFFGLASPFLNTDTPGPTKYDYKLSWGKKGWVFTSAERFHSPHTYIPSPDAYTPLNTSMQRTEHSFNTRLAKCIAKKKHLPDEMSFHKRLHLPKKLRCFPESYTLSPMDEII